MDEQPTSSNGYFPSSCAIIHSLHFESNDDRLIGLLKAKIFIKHDGAPRFSSVRQYTLVTPSDNIDASELEAYCADMHIPIPEKRTAEGIQQLIPQLLKYRDHFDLQRENLTLSGLIDQLGQRPVESDQLTAKAKLLDLLVEAYKIQNKEQRSISRNKDIVLLNEIDQAREALISTCNANSIADDGLLSFNQSLENYFIETSWCLARKTAEGLDWFPDDITP